MFRRLKGVAHNRAASALATREARFRATFENAAVGISHLSRDGRWLRANNKICEITGYSREELMNLAAADVTPPEEVGEGRELSEQLWAGKIPMYTRTKRSIRKDGEVIWLRLTCALVRKLDGSPDYMITFAEDISNEKRAELASEASSRLLESVIENLPAMVFIKNANNLCFERFNREAQKVLGFLCHDYVGKDVYALFPKEQADHFTQSDREVLASNDLIEIKEETIQTRDGRERSLRTAKIALRDADGIPTHILVAALDITELKQTEEQIKLLMREIDHRAKNLLTVVQAVARQTAVDADPLVFAERFSRRLDGLAASHDLLAKNRWTGVDLSELIRSQLAHFGHLLGTRVLFAGPPVRLKASAAQALGMALHELATNAIKHGALSGGQGAVSIVWQAAYNGSAPHLRISWKEQGGPPIQLPCRTGFGHTVMVRMVEHHLEGDVKLTYAPTGLIWEVNAPLGRFTEQAV